MSAMNAPLDPRRLPPIARDLIRVVGEEAALKLIETFRTQRLWVPSAPGPDHPITLCIGPKLAAQLGWWLSPGDHIDFPLLAGALRAERDAAILAASESATTSDLTQRYGVSRRTVFRAKQRTRQAEDAPAAPDAPPRDLFSDL
jgi:hypothetical protein